MATFAVRNAGGAPAAALAAAQAAEIAARLGARMGEPAEKLNKGALQGFEYPRRYPGYLPAVPSEPLSGSLLTPQSTSVGQTTAAEDTAEGPSQERDNSPLCADSPQDVDIAPIPIAPAYFERVDAKPASVSAVVGELDLQGRRLMMALA
eukprot:s2510_g10.t1